MVFWYVEENSVEGENTQVEISLGKVEMEEKISSVRTGGFPAKELGVGANVFFQILGYCF